MAEKRLNLLGEVCPVPLMITQEEIAKLSSGDTLVLETDMGQTVRNILRWCENHDYVFEVDETENGVWIITITK